MYYAMTTREDLVAFLPPGGTGGEIGVAQGDFSAVLLERAGPSRLHLIDPWAYVATPPDPREFLDDIARRQGPVYGPDYNELGEAQYRAVCDRFAGRPEVVIHQQYSYNIVRDFADRTFDFVYIDGNHTYEFVLQDLFDFAPKLKEDGLILGHDFFEDAFAREQRYGVIDAVNRFLRRSKDFRLVCLTSEPFPSFVLARKDTGFAGRFLANLLESDVFLIEIADEQAFRYEEKSFSRRDGSRRRIPSFAS